VDTGGVVLLVVVLVAATGFGVYRKVTDGRMRQTLPIRGLAGAAGVAANGSAIGSVSGSAGAVELGTATERLTAGDLGAPLGERATLVQFSSAFCAPCRTTRTLLADVAATVPGVTYVDVDAESQLDLVRRHAVLRTPTVFVLDAQGHVVRRAVGAPRRADVIGALGDAIV
jgi:thiol-disulfide isomerase/thioredoxin